MPRPLAGRSTADDPPHAIPSKSPLCELRPGQPGRPMPVARHAFPSRLPAPWARCRLNALPTRPSNGIRRQRRRGAALACRCLTGGGIALALLGAWQRAALAQQPPQQQQQSSQPPAYWGGGLMSPTPASGYGANPVPPRSSTASWQGGPAAAPSRPATFESPDGLAPSGPAMPNLTITPTNPPPPAVGAGPSTPPSAPHGTDSTWCSRAARILEKYRRTRTWPERTAGRTAIATIDVGDWRDHAPQSIRRAQPACHCWADRRRHGAAVQHAWPRCTVSDSTATR